MFRRVLKAPIPWGASISQPLTRPYTQAVTAPAAPAAVPAVIQERIAPVIRVTLIKSRNSSHPSMVKTLDSLGLTKMHRGRLHKNVPAIRGMINKVLIMSSYDQVKSYVEIEEIF